MAKYPSPSEARSNFEIGVEAARDKWVARARAGATAYETWFTGFANTVYPIIATLPSKEAAGATAAERYAKRGAPVAEAIRKLSQSYKAAKLREIAKAAAPLVKVSV